jgi:hypothetical protein
VQGGIGQEHRHLAVLDAPRGAGVLALHTDRAAARLQISGVVQNQHRVAIAQRVDHVLPHVVAHFVGLSDRLTQQSLHPVRHTVTGPLGHLPTRPGVHIGQQPEQERPSL